MYFFISSSIILTTIQPNEGENVAKESNADKRERELTALWGCVLPALSPSQNTRMAQPQYRELGWRKPPFWKNTVEPWWKTALLREHYLFTPIYWNNTHHISMHVSPSSMTASLSPHFLLIFRVTFHQGFHRYSQQDKEHRFTGNTETIVQSMGFKIGRWTAIMVNFRLK